MPELRPQVYLDERPPERFERSHEWARAHEPRLLYLLARIVLTPVCLALFRLRTNGRENVPARGPVLLAPNHFSAWDHFFCGVPLRRPVRFMAKSQLYRRPLGALLTRLGAFPVRRGRRDEEAVATARSILGRGGVVVIYPEGGRSRSGQLGHPRPGIGRLALESGAPVVPVAIHGSLGIRHWDRHLLRLRLPKVTVVFGPPIVFTRSADPSRDEQQAAADLIFTRVRAAYDDLEHTRRGGAPRPTVTVKEAGDLTPSSIEPD